jgi:outer membrane protein TolC
MFRLVHSPGSILAAVAVATLGGCTSYDPDPLAPLQLLDELDRVRLDAPRDGIALVGSATRFDPTNGLTDLEAASLAIHLNPSLRALRAEIGVARAQLVEAGLLPDPVIGWDAMNVVADFTTERKSSSNSYVAGASLIWEVPRPDEIDAREAVAHGQLSQARAILVRAEWELVRDVRLAYLRLAAAQAGVDLASEQAEIANGTVDYFERARRAGAATALQERLATVARDRVLADRVRLALDEIEARNELLMLAGLPPETPLILEDVVAMLDAPFVLPEPAGALVRVAVERRPDVLELAAAYEQAEGQLRLEVARQWPQLWIGTGISVSLPFLTRFNAWGVERATRERDAARDRFVATLHATRREVHQGVEELSRAAEQVALFREQLMPGLEETLRLTRAALEAGEVTPIEILAAQNQVIGVSFEFLTARERLARARVVLDAASARLLPPPPVEVTEEEDQE